MTNSQLLKKKIVESGVSKVHIAKKLGISRFGLYKKIDGETEFKASEIVLMTDILRLSKKDRDIIFLSLG